MIKTIYETIHIYLQKYHHNLLRYLAVVEPMHVDAKFLSQPQDDFSNYKYCITLFSDFWYK